MLIDAAHPEEVRVAVVHGDRVEEFDFESASKAQLKGNIYLARVTRVEPSLQAAFVDYGGNRHGFLAFSEIHPDYYQIPVSDREALIEEERLSEKEDEEPVEEAAAEAVGASVSDETDPEKPDSDEVSDDDDDDDDDDSEPAVELVGAEDALEEVPERRKPRRHRQYKIQEVIKRRQILLIQVVKEERGNKGAALTTYLSLAGRYCVLMPNTDRGGGISRKITNAVDRKRLKETAGDLNVPSGMGVIIRTAGANRTKAEIKRDYEYLLRLWENIRDLTLKSIAPCLVYEEGNLIKRSIRDLYSREIDQVLVEGDAAYKQAKGFMKMLMPSHAKNVQPYKDKQPIFVRFHVENQLDAMFSPIVTLPSGGYLVINQAEALVAIDVNSGKGTKKHSIEETARMTNLEAAEEISRQLRLRDLAGLIVIDFIDMEEKRNNRAVEKRIKDKLKSDRARIQVGRISHFGLLEMSRQRLRSSVLEGTTDSCPHCQGTGLIRSVESSALHIMRAIEMHALNGGSSSMTVNASPEVSCYVLNRKRQHILNLESRFGISIYINPDDSLIGASSVIRKGVVDEQGVSQGESVIKIDSVFSTASDLPESPASAQPSESEQEKRSSRRRRRRKPRSRSANTEQAEIQENAEAETTEQEDNSAASDGESEKTTTTTRRRRRGKRGGRRHNRNEVSEAREAEASDVVAVVDEALGIDEEKVEEASQEVSKDSETDASKTAEKPVAKKPRRRTRSPRKPREDTGESAPSAKVDAKSEAVAEKPEEKPKKARRKPAVKKETKKTTAGDDKALKQAAPIAVEEKQPAPVEVPVVAEKPVTEKAQDADTGPKRRGWWSFGGK